MGRPYYNRISKGGRLNIVDTRIKRKDVSFAIEKLMGFRNSMDHNLLPHNDDTSNMIFRLPPEIRNRIYGLVLPSRPLPLIGSRATMVTPTFELLQTSRTGLEADTGSACSMNNQMRDSGANLLYLCKQIALEAQSLMEGFNIAYIPVLSSMNFAHLIANIIHHGVSSLPPIQRTIFNAITSFSNIHFHLHINYRYSGKTDDLEPYLDSNYAYMYGYIRQLLIIYTCGSATKFRHLESSNTKRKVIVHFDHLFSDWRHMHAMAGCYKFKHLVQIMGSDKTTDWNIRYYVHAGGPIKEQGWSEWDERLTKEFSWLKEECGRFPNIKLTAEVYGELSWSLEGQTDGVTRCITPSSTLWPSWPDDVPWRRFTRVRSDGARPNADDA